MNFYTYDGPVMEFEKCIADHWKGSTYAVSDKKAMSNLATQFKKYHNKLPSAKITLSPKKLTSTERKETPVGRL